MQLTKLMVPASKYNIKCPYEMKADGICVHNTANKASAMAEVSYMVGNNNKVSYHYAIDDYRIVQGIEENRNAWHAGDGSKGNGNRNKIAIEICHSTNPDTAMFDKAEKLAAKFIAYKLKEKGWGIDRVSKHQDYSKKYCPHKTLDLGWQRFLNLIKAELEKTNQTTNSNTVALKYKVGDKVNVSSYYASSTDPNEKAIYKNKTGTITKVLTNGAKNPYLLDNGNVGWCNDGDIRGYATTTPTRSYYPACNKKYNSITAALKSIGVNSSFDNRKKIAIKNNIRNYTGTAQQNVQLLTKLKAGRLIKI